MVNTCGLFQRDKAHFHGNQQQIDKENHNNTLNKLALAKSRAVMQNTLWLLMEGRKNISKTC